MRYNQIKPLSEQTLTEINMSPGGLRKLAAQINAKAGMEFEMIVPNAAGDSDNEDGEQEPDYDRDERARSIDDIVHFYHDGDYNGRREVERLQSQLKDDYQEWVSDKMGEEWQENGRLYLEDYIRENDFDMDAAKEAATDDIRETNPELPAQSEEFAKLVNRHAYEKLVEVTEESWESQDNNYDYAREEFEEEKRDNYDEQEWLEDANLDTMSDIDNRYDITWPHWTNGSDGSNEGRSIEDIADDFSGAIGRPINHSTKYHGAKRTADGYVVEPDGSLEGDEPGDAGLEFVSPPLPVAELLSDLQKVKQWADKEGAYTGAKNGTGLHINVSVEDWAGSMEQLDFVKLAILLGDEYILKQFERQANTYCKSAIGLVQKEITNNPDKAAQLLNQMKSHLNIGASKLIHAGTTSKFTSINTKDGYIEFRSPGGDWLNDKFELIEPTLLRCVVALDAAVKPELYKQEYQKKLYKLLSPSTDKYGAMIKDFSDYVAGVGGAPESVVKSFRRAALEVLQRQSGRVNKPQAQQSGNWGIWAHAADKFAALATAAGSPLRRFKTEKQGHEWIAQMTLRPERFDVREIPADYENTAAAADPGAAYKQYTVQDRSGYSMLITAASPMAAKTQAETMFPDRFQEVVSVVLYEPRGQQQSTPIPGSTLDLQQQRAAQSQPATNNFPAMQQWRIMMGDQQVFVVNGATQGAANRAATIWLSQRSPEFNQQHAGQEVEVLPVQQQ
jgi:hypothetical protein